jgi:anti-sigma B factor antagonist
MSQHLYRHTQEGGIHVVELTLPLSIDHTEFDKLNETIGELVESTPADRWVIDLKEVEYIGSALLGLLVNLRQRVKAGGGTLILCGLSAQVTKALKTCSLHNLFTIADKRDSAVKRAML